MVLRLWNKWRGTMLAALAAVLFVTALAVPAVRACIADSAIRLVQGELPGGG